MKKKITGLFVILILTIVIFTSCASAFELADAAYNRKDYTTAIKKSLEALREEPGLAAAETLLKNSWNKANKEWWDEIRYYEKSSAFDNIKMDLPDWVKIKTDETKATVEDLEKTLPIYDKLYNIHIIIESARRFDLKPNPDSIYEKGMKTRTKVADIYFAMGDAQLAIETRDNARNAMVYYEKVNSLIKNYPNLSEKYKEATDKATVKVVICQNSNNDDNMDILSNMQDKIGSSKLIDIVQITNRFDSPNSDALNFAKSYNADLLVYVDVYSSVKADRQTTTSPISVGVTSVYDWKLNKDFLLVSGESNVTCLVIDLDANKFISQKTFTVKDSTDFGLAIYSLDAPIKYETVKLGTMKKEKKLRSASLVEGSFPSDLTTQLAWYEKLTFNTENGNSLAVNSRPNLFTDEYNNAKALANQKDINGHLFIPFDIIKMPSQDPNNIRYRFTYNQALGEDNDDNIKASQFDRAMYSILKKSMGESYFKVNSANIFLKENLAVKVNEAIISNILPTLK